MTNILKRLKLMENNKLIDVVKNHRQYGYSDELRNEALSILKSRGIDELELKLTGNFQNSTYDRALSFYEDYKRNSKIAFGLYTYLLLGNILIIMLLLDWEYVDFFTSIVNLIVLITYLFFLLLSFVNQSNFYKKIGKAYSTEGALIYFLIGMPLYIFMYFYFNKQMREQLKTVQ